MDERKLGWGSRPPQTPPLKPLRGYAYGPGRSRIREAASGGVCGRAGAPPQLSFVRRENAEPAGIANAELAGTPNAELIGIPKSFHH